MNIKDAKPINDLELFDLIVAAYPDKFNKNDDPDHIWDDVMQFVEEKFGDTVEVCEFLGRIIYLTPLMGSAITGQAAHCLGEVTVKDGKAHMTAVVKRMIAA